MITGRFVSAVALYGPKAEPVRRVLATIQALIGEHTGNAFLPYSLEQIHATLIAFNGVRDPDGGAIVNQYFLEHTGARRTMDPDLAMRILTERFARPLPVRAGGYRPEDDGPFRSRGQHLYQRTFSAQGDAFVLVGWPVSADGQSDRLPLDRLRRDLNAAGLLHRYHPDHDAIDGDLHLVVGHHRGAPPGALDAAVTAVRDQLAACPVEFSIGLGDVSVVAADNHTLAPPLYVSPVPADADAVLALAAGAPASATAGGPAASPQQRAGLPLCAGLTYVYDG